VRVSALTGLAAVGYQLEIIIPEDISRMVWVMFSLTTVVPV